MTSFETVSNLVAAEFTSRRQASAEVAPSASVPKLARPHLRLGPRTKDPFSAMSASQLTVDFLDQRDVANNRQCRLRPQVQQVIGLFRIAEPS